MGAEASGLWAGEPDGLVGRDGVLAALRDLVDESSRTALVVGIPGAGKTSVLDQVRRAAAADGWTVLAVTGHRADRDVPYAVLDDLVPVDGLPTDDPLRLRRTVFDLLSRRAGDGRLLLVLDDTHWCDESSLSVLAFVAGRLQGTSVSLLAAARLDQAPSALAELPRVELPALSEREADLLIRRAGIDLDSLTRPSVIERAAGNPLALLELSRAAAAGASSTVPSSVESVFADEVASLPGSSRYALLLAAAAGGDLGVLGRVVDPDRLLADLAPAERIGLVRVADREVRFRHPLARAAAYSSPTAQERIAAHRALAEAYVDDLDRQVWHRAEASLVPDEEVARQLVEIADRARFRGATIEAARALIRAAELSPARHDRDQRHLDAIGLNLPPGHVRWLADVARTVCDESDDPVVRARATHFYAYALSQTARQDAARRALVDAMEQLEVHLPYAALGSLSTLAYLTYSSGSDTGLVAAWLERLIGAVPGPATPPTAADSASPLFIGAVIDPLHASEETLDRVRRPAAPEHEPHLQATAEMMLGATGLVLGETAAAVERYRTALELMERARFPGMVPQTLSGFAQSHFDGGFYDEVVEQSRLIVDLADAGGMGYAGAVGRVLLAQVAAVRGDATTARALAGEVLMSLEVGESLAVEAYVHVALGFSAFSEHDAAGCFEQLRWLFTRDGQPVHTHVSYQFLADVVAAAVRAGRTDDVTSVMAVAEERLADAVPRCRFQLARARALVAGDDAEQFHVEATANPVATQWPLALANARLEYGAWLRRRHRPTAARAELTAAYDVFARLGARALAELARAELRAAGVHTDPEPASWDDLTTQEREVVRLAASGMTNREIGASLYLSPRTVSAHLYKAFPKLGVTSRAQLRDVVEARDRG